jgi:ferric-dicitrate binding protein FerR (iron transport regulator)
MLMLNTASRARVQFSRSVREVCLLQGEALFEVARDAAAVRHQGADCSARAGHGLRRDCAARKWT